VPTLLKKGRKAQGHDDAATPMPAPEAEAAPTTEMQAPPPAEAPAPRRQPAPRAQDLSTYTPPDGADDFQLPPRIVVSEPPRSPEPPRASGSLLNRILGEPGETTAQERDRIAAEEFEQAIAPVMDLMREYVPGASTPEEAERILAANQAEVTPDPKGGSYIYGDAFDRDARVYYRLLRRDYEKNPRPSEKRPKSHHLHEIYGKLTGNKGW
jgi:hypothetical protein